MPDDRVSVFDAEGSRYVLAGANVRWVMALFCCTFSRRAALSGGVTSLPLAVRLKVGLRSVAGLSTHRFVSMGPEKIAY